MIRWLRLLWLKHERNHLRASIEYEERREETHTARMIAWRQELALINARIDRERINSSTRLSGIKRGDRTVTDKFDKRR